MNTRESKLCQKCGRTMTWRRKWANNWDAVKYCSTACRKAGVNDTDNALATAIMQLLDARSANDSICPSEAARRIGGDDWRALMEPARQASRRLVADGRILVMQKGRVVDASTARGPIRLKKR